MAFLIFFKQKDQSTICIPSDQRSIDLKMVKGEGEFKDSVLLNGSCGREAEDFWQNVESPVAVAESETSEGENLHEVTCSVTELKGEIADAVMENSETPGDLHGVTCSVTELEGQIAAAATVNSKTPEESHRLKNLVELVEDEDWNQVKARPGVSDSAGESCVSSSTMCHQHAHVPSSAHLFESSAWSGSSGGLLGAPGWAVGQVSARLSSSWCCPGCGLYGDRSLCMTCGTYGVGNGWTPLLRTPSSGVWLFRGGALRGEHLLAALVSTVDWVARGTNRTAWAVEPRCLCSYAYGRRVAVGPQTGARSWELLRVLWKAIAPQLTPWCASEDMPTCANLNYYGGPGSCVRWHSDDEVLFGGRGESKLIVSLSIGFSALFRKPRPSPDCEADSTWLHHGDLLVMDGRCQDEDLHSTDPRLHGERVKITFRWLKNHVPQCPLGAGAVCCLPTCVKGLPVPVCAGLDGLVWNSGWVLWFLLGMGLLLLAFLALVGLWHQKSMYFWVTPLCTLQDACLSFCHARETPGVHAGLVFWVLGVLGWFLGFWGFQGNGGTMPGTLVGVWPPSLSDYDACLVFWSNWAFEGNNGRPKRETSFPFPLPRGKSWVFLSKSDFYETVFGKSALASLDWEG